MEELRAICRLIIDTNSEVSNLVLQKLLYFIQAYRAVKTGVPAFENRMEAWTYGPVIPEVYFRFRDDKENFLNVDTNILEEDLRNDIILIVNQLGSLDPFTLVDATHNYQPWNDAWHNSNKEITFDSIREYHSQRSENGEGIF